MTKRGNEHEDETTSPAGERSPAFQFYPKEWIYSTQVLTLADQGRLFRNISNAIMAGDKEALAKQRGTFIGRVYWYEKPSRPQISPAIRLAVYRRDGHRCRTCGSEQRLELDHIIPWSHGGPDTVENLRVLCKSCNVRRGTSPVEP